MKLSTADIDKVKVEDEVEEAHKPLIFKPFLCDLAFCQFSVTASQQAAHNAAFLVLETNGCRSS